MPPNMNPNNSDMKQLISSIVLLVIIITVLFIVEFFYSISSTKQLRFITVLDETITSESGSIKSIPQDPSKPNSIPLGISVNERTGIEFAYSFYLYVNNTTFTGNQVLKHVFHKGYSTNPWPLMGPGVFVLGNTNTMRVIMNTQTNPYAYIDIKNIPVQKWFHVVLNCYSSGLDVYVNGNLANRLSLKNNLAYQNFQDVVIFYRSSITLNKTVIPSLNSHHNNIEIQGAISGSISAMKYARYALSIHEIRGLMSEGPSKKITVPVQETPPYNANNWWTDQQ
jgi:hypothetical protein